MYVPMKAGELFNVKCDVEDITLIIVPCTGDLEFAIEQILNSDNNDIVKINGVFNAMVKGYTLSDEKKTTVMFGSGDTPSDYFTIPVKAWVTQNSSNFSNMSIEQKKR